MKAGQTFLAMLLTAATFGALALVLSREGQVPLVPVAEGPRPPIAPDARTKPMVLSGLYDRVAGKGNELRRLRNDLAREHREAIQAWRAGEGTLREVERLEQLLWVARHRVGEIDERTMHARLAELFARERDRLVQLFERGMAGQDQVARANLYVARERHLAGEVVRDDDGRDYETMRREYLQDRHDQYKTLIEAGLGHPENMRVDLLKLAEEFPPVEPR